MGPAVKKKRKFKNRDSYNILSSVSSLRKKSTDPLIVKDIKDAYKSLMTALQDKLV